MLNHDDRLVIWQEFHERVEKLLVDVEDALYSKFAPYRFENGQLVKADKDAPEVKKLFDALLDLDAVLQRKVESSSEECGDWYEEQHNMQDAFEAWSLGLCPQVIIPLSHQSSLYGSEHWEQIAHLKQSKGINVEDTKQAVALWEAQRVVERLAV